MSRRQTKTYLMQLVERDHNNTPIQDLMIEAYHKYGTERAAAQALGITQQSFNAWKFRLGLENQITPINQVPSDLHNDQTGGVINEQTAT